MTFKKTMRSFLKLIGCLCFLVLLILVGSLTMMNLRENQTIENSYPSYGRLIDTGDGRVFVQEAGDKGKPTILLIHGTGAWSEIWRETIDFLGKNDFHVVALDVPPFGYSEKLNKASSYTSERQAKRFLEVIKQLDLKNVTLICHSVGCRSAIETALIDTRAFDKIVLVDAALGFSSNADSPAFQQNNPPAVLNMAFSSNYFRDAVIGLYGSSPYSIKPIFSSFVYNKESVSDKRLEVLKQPLALQNMTRSEGDWLENLSMAADKSLYTNYDNLRQINVPTLIIWGEKDNVTPPWQAKTLASFIPKSEIALIPNTGHIPYIEEPEIFQRGILRFIKK